MIRFAALPLALAVAAAPLLAQAKLSPADQTAAFRAAGFKRVGTQWQACGDPGTASYTPGAIESVGGWPDLEIGRPGFCFPVLCWNGRAYALHRH